MAVQSRPRKYTHRRLQFSLLTLLVVMLISGPLLAWLWKKSTQRPQPAQCVKTGGRITLADGSPLSNVDIAFYPTAKGYAASGATDQLGRFIMSTFEENDGAVPGSYSVHAADNSGSFLNMSLSPAKPSATLLTVSVVAGQPNSFHFVAE